MATIQNDKIEIQITIPRDRLTGLNSSETVEYVAYDFFAALFEYGGEFNHRPDGSRVLICNGHHVAQKMSELVKQEWERHLNPPKEYQGETMQVIEKRIDALFSVCAGLERRITELEEARKIDRERLNKLEGLDFQKRIPLKGINES